MQQERLLIHKIMSCCLVYLTILKKAGKKYYSVRAYCGRPVSEGVVELTETPLLKGDARINNEKVGIWIRHLY